MSDTSLLEQLATRISSCRKCDDCNFEVNHSTSMNRGTGHDIIVIGVNPGRSEILKSEAFVGLAGKRLISWLKEAGIGDDRIEIFARCYLTSLCKCHIPNNKDLSKAISLCLPFLEEQITLIKPKICLTLGKEPLQALFHYRGSLEDVVGQQFSEKDLYCSLIPMLPDDCIIIPFPHPSPLSHWLNEITNRNLLNSAIGILSRTIDK